MSHECAHTHTRKPCTLTSSSNCRCRATPLAISWWWGEQKTPNAKYYYYCSIFSLPWQNMFMHLSKQIFNLPTPFATLDCQYNEANMSACVFVVVVMFYHTHTLCDFSLPSLIDVGTPGLIRCYTTICHVSMVRWNHFALTSFPHLAISLDMKSQRHWSGIMLINAYAELFLC